MNKHERILKNIREILDDAKIITNGEWLQTLPFERQIVFLVRKDYCNEMHLCKDLPVSCTDCCLSWIKQEHKE